LELLPQQKKAVADRYLGRGDRQVVECSLPALFTVEKGLNDPRYPSLANRLSAEREDIEVIEPASLGFSTDNDMDLTRYMTLSPPRPKPRKIFTPESNLSASERMRLLMSGGLTEKSLVCSKEMQKILLAE
jgi:electron transfer flavoprotein beta subunit